MAAVTVGGCSVIFKQLPQSTDAAGCWQYFALASEEQTGVLEEKIVFFFCHLVALFVEKNLSLRNNVVM